MDALFPHVKPLGDFVLIVSYDGPTFQGRMPIHDLKGELEGLEDCITSTLFALEKYDLIKVNPFDVQIVVEAFRHGSFTKKILLIPKKIEKYPATTAAAVGVALILVGVGQIMATKSSDEIREMSPDLMREIGDRVKVELLSDNDFLKSYGKIAAPLGEKGDFVTLTKPDNTSLTIDQKNKETFVELAGEDDVLLDEVTEALEGHVTMVSLNALKNAVGFRVNDAGPTVPCSFLANISVEDRKALLDKWIRIEGVTQKAKKERRHITIYSYKILERPEQKTMFVSR